MTQGAPSPARIQIAPSILASDFLHLGDAVRQAEAGGADRLHIDVMDGRFVPNITIGPPIVSAIRSATNMFLETHLMIVEPEKYVRTFADAGANLVIVHLEVSPHIYRTLQHVHDCGARAGVAINPGTSWRLLEDVLDLADLVLVMTVSPGFGGQAFIETMLPKIRSVRETLDRRSLETELEIDGGVNEETAPRAVEAGARVLVAGTSVYRDEAGVQESIHELRQAARGGLSAVADLTR